VLPISVYERANRATYNSVVVVDADGAVLGTYRKSHIPDGPGYTEKYYFNPGDTGFRVWETRCGTVGVGICWDQWFPESARCMALLGADVLCYPTAIGSEPPDPDWDSSGHWQRVMQGHAGANLTPLVASNRIGLEVGTTTEITFYGSSFIADRTGAKVAEASRDGEAVLTATFDLDAGRRDRHSWGVFRDRRPDLYGALLTFDGVTHPS
jgi:N-carbamoylputrescine amidase